jgi:hypothetical protein
MKGSYIFIILFILSVNLFAQDEELFKMKKKETNNYLIEKLFTSDSHITLTDITEKISGLAVSGKIRLEKDTSLVRIVLVTKEHEYLVYEAYPLICDELSFSFENVCDETAFLNSEIPIRMDIILRNATIKLQNICYSIEPLEQKEITYFDESRHKDKAAKEKFKTTKINHNNSLKNKTWVADTTTISLIPFEKKKNLFGGKNNYLTDGFEYYSDGIFSFEDFDPSQKNTLKSAMTTTYVSNFDWRNRHGQNWITSVKNQTYNCGSCWAFSAIATIEAMMNIYYNNYNIDLDLSEQEIVSCTQYCNCSGGYNDDALYRIINYGITNESCFPYSATNEACSNKCSLPSYTVTIQSSDVVSSYSETTLKDALINIGPIASGFDNTVIHHSMALVGYKQLIAGDVIRYVIDDGGIDSTIGAGNPLIGQTYWIFKNSYGTSWNGGGTGGYFYVFFQTLSQIVDSYTAEIPSSTISYTRNCTDNDNDGYYWWGTGSKPSTCPACSPNTPDGDDSNSTIGPMDSYGNSQTITTPYCCPTEVTGTETWTSIRNDCGGVVVKSGGNLTLNGATINIPDGKTFTVETGGLLTLTQGTIQ